MAAALGRNAYITYADNTVENLYDWTLTMESNPIEQAVFGDVWGKTHGLGVNKWSGTFEGIYDAADTTGQQALIAAQLASTKLQNVKFYMDTGVYYYPDTDTDADAGIYITNHEISTDPEDVGRITFSFNGTGALTTSGTG